MKCFPLSQNRRCASTTVHVALIRRKTMEGKYQSWEGGYTVPRSLGRRAGHVSVTPLLDLSYKGVVLSG